MTRPYAYVRNYMIPAIVVLFVAIGLVFLYVFPDAVGGSKYASYIGYFFGFALVIGGVVYAIVLGETRRISEERTRAQATEIERMKNVNENIINTVPSVLLVIDSDYKVNNANLAYYKIFPRTVTEIAGESICEVLCCPHKNRDVCARDTECSIMNAIKTAQENNERCSGDDYEYRSEYYGTKYFHYSLMPFHGNNPEARNKEVLMVLSDVSVQRRKQQQVEHLTKVIHAISDIGQIIIREETKQSLLSNVCKALMKVKGYKFAWIGIINNNDKIIHPEAQAGEGNGYLDSIEMTWGNEPSGMGPGGISIKARSPFVVHNIEEDPSFELWRQEALSRGFYSCVSVPLAHGETVFGNLEVYSENVNHFDEEETKLLVEVADDIGFAINAIETGQAKMEIEGSLRESEYRYKMLFENARDVIFQKDLDGNYISFNLTGEAAFGIPPGEWLGKTDYDLHPKELADKFKRDEATVASTGEPLTTLDRMSINGNEKWFETIKQPVKDQSGEIVGIMGIARDITDRRQLEDQLRQAQKMEVIGQLAGGIAHDFNNLLQAIIGYNSLLLARIPSEHDIYQYAKEVERASETAAQLTNQLLAFGRRQILNYEILDVNEVVMNMAKMLRRIIGEHIDLEIISTNDTGFVNADRTQLQQILMNLCINARDAMAKGGRLVVEMENININRAYCVTHPWARPGKFLLLTVSDTGHGIAKENLERIFEPFYTTKDPGKGTGLGLSMVYGIVKQHNGMIHAYSEIDKGTVFKIYLPINEQKIEIVEEQIAIPVVGGTETLLFAEDDEIICNLTKKVLEAQGYRIILANDGQQAVELFEQHRDEITMAVFDVVMPKLGGYEAYELIKKRKPSIKVLFLSGYSAKAMNSDLAVKEEHNILAKPYHPDELLRRLREILDL